MGTQLVFFKLGKGGGECLVIEQKGLFFLTDNGTIYGLTNHNKRINE